MRDFVDAPPGGRHGPDMSPWLRIVALVTLLWPQAALADARPLDSIDDVHGACGTARERLRPHLYVIEVQDGWHFGALTGGALAVDTGRNFRALDGHVSVLIPRHEQLGFEVDAEAAAHLREAADAGGRLRVGFFLGFDDRERQPCLVRNRHAVTIIRADVAYLELVASDGEPVARAETDRFRAWADDREELGIPGEGPRGAVGEAHFADGQSAPASWQRALGSRQVIARIARCHAEGVGRGASAEGQVVVRLNIDARTGRVRRADIALSSLGDGDETQCIARALGASLPPGPAGWRAAVVDLSVPVRLVTD